jgi:hypothetical protein
MTDTTRARAPMSPGTYMRKRREAAGFTIDQVAMLVVRPGPTPRATHAELARIRNELAMLEGDHAGRYVRLMGHLSLVVAFDPAIYTALAAAADGAAEPVPSICRVCACSWSDPCLIPAGDGSADVTPCAWTDAGGTLCTACKGDDGEPGEAAFLPLANDAEASHAA